MKILVADDDKTTRIYVTGALRKLGYSDLIECSDGRSALEHLTSQEPPQIAFLDWMMPEMTGPEICRSIKRNLKVDAIYLMLLTSRDSKEDILEGLRAGANDYLTKPVNYAELISRFDIGVQISKLRAQLKNQEMQLLQSAKMASLGTMTAGIAHEINNPLAIISGSVDQLLRLLGETDHDTNKLIEKSKRIKDTVFRISKIISGLHSFAGNSNAEQSAAVDFNEIIDDAHSFCETKFRSSQIAFRRHIDAQTSAVHCKKIQISQVLLNLLNNAYLAIRESTGAKWIEVTLNEFKDEFKVAVTDSGPGIPPEVRAHLMEPFFTTRGIGQGSGLGLSISRTIVEAHGGRLFLDENCPNTRFVFTLPKPVSAP